MAVLPIRVCTAIFIFLIYEKVNDVRKNKHHYSYSIRRNAIFFPNVENRSGSTAISGWTNDDDMDK